MRSSAWRWARPLISVFARLGGGIYTKAADVGADLTGKIEQNLDEDDPRNPATIADNVGDNVGDCAGMAADVFETYAVSLIGAVLVGALTFAADPNALAYIVYPFLLCGLSVIASVLGILLINVGSFKPATALLAGVALSAVVSAVLFAPLTYWMFPDGWLMFYVPALVGLAMTFITVLITNYYTATGVRAGAQDREGLGDGPRDEHHRGPRGGLARDVLPGGGDRAFDRDFLCLPRPLRRGRRGGEHAEPLGLHHFARCVRADHGQRGRPWR